MTVVLLGWICRYARSARKSLTLASTHYFSSPALVTVIWGRERVECALLFVHEEKSVMDYLAVASGPVKVRQAAVPPAHASGR